MPRRSTKGPLDVDMDPYVSSNGITHIFDTKHHVERPHHLLPPSARGRPLGPPYTSTFPPPLAPTPALANSLPPPYYLPTR